MKWMVAVALAATALLAVGAASAGGTTQLRGVQRPAVEADGCGVGDGIAWMQGSGRAGVAGLVGCWYTTSFEVGVFTPSGVLTARGTEEFWGCLDQGGDGACDPGDPGGSLTLSFSFSAKFDPATFALLHGRCQHPITGGTGDFAGATGELRFKDDPETGCSYYSGHVTLAGSAGANATAAVRASRVSAVEVLESLGLSAGEAVALVHQARRGGPSAGPRGTLWGDGARSRVGALHARVLATVPALVTSGDVA